MCVIREILGKEGEGEGEAQDISKSALVLGGNPTLYPTPNLLARRNNRRWLRLEREEIGEQ